MLGKKHEGNSITNVENKSIRMDPENQVLSICFLGNLVTKLTHEQI